MVKNYIFTLFLFLSFAVFSQTTKDKKSLKVSKQEQQYSFSKDQQIEGLKIYPNPVTDGNLYIKSLKNSEKHVKIFDVLGKNILSRKMLSYVLNVSDLKPGVYILKVTENDKTATRKLVIK